MKIDLVYLWCDGADPVWCQKRESYLPAEEKRDLQTFCKGRIFNNDELRYSLRSVEMYAPWINHIFIVTDNQCPDWLDTSNEKVTVIDHTDLLPKESLPSFNSCAIELCIASIKGLSEHYLYANDDMMFARRVKPNFFFTSSDKVISRCILSKPIPVQRAERSSYLARIKLANDTISADYNLPEMVNWKPHHNIDAYKKSCVLECIDKYRSWSQSTLSHRFRSPEDMQKHTLLLYAVAVGESDIRLIRGEKRFLRTIEMILRYLRLKKGRDSLMLYVEDSYPELRIRSSRPYLFCFNDGENVTDEDRVRIKGLMHRIFPRKSKFEL